MVLVLNQIPMKLFNPERGKQKYLLEWAFAGVRFMIRSEMGFVVDDGKLRLLCLKPGAKC